MDKGLIERLTPEQVEAYAAWDCGVETDKPFSARQLTILRLAYVAGWKAAEEKALADVEALRRGLRPFVEANARTKRGIRAEHIVAARKLYHGDTPPLPNPRVRPSARTLIDGGDNGKR